MAGLSIATLELDSADPRGETLVAEGERLGRVQHLGAIRSVTVSAMVFSTAAGPGLTGTLIDLDITLPRQMFWIGSYCLAAALVMTGVAIQLRQRA